LGSVTWVKDNVGLINLKKEGPKKSQRSFFIEEKSIPVEKEGKILKERKTDFFLGRGTGREES